MNKFWWFVTGAVVTGIGLSGAAAGPLIEDTRYMRYASDSTGDYQLDMSIIPGRQRVGGGQYIEVILKQNGKPYAQQQVTLKGNGQSEKLVTASDGTALFEVTNFSVKKVTYTATYTTPGGKTLQVNATAQWAQPQRDR